MREPSLPHFTESYLARIAKSMIAPMASSAKVEGSGTSVASMRAWLGASVPGLVHVMPSLVLASKGVKPTPLPDGSPVQAHSIDALEPADWRVSQYRVLGDRVTPTR